MDKYVPIDFLKLPDTVTTIGQAVDCIRLCDELCALIQSQNNLVKNSAFLRACLIEHVFVHIIPVPQVSNYPQYLPAIIRNY